MRSSDGSSSLRGAWLIAAVVAGGLLLGSIAQAAEGARVYRWVDRQGHVHYGDVPSQNSVELNPRAPVPNDGAVAGGAKQVNAEDCERRRKEVESYRVASKVTETNSLGESRELSDAERAKLIERADNLARTACGDAPKASGGNN